MVRRFRQMNMYLTTLVYIIGEIEPSSSPSTGMPVSAIISMVPEIQSVFLLQSSEDIDL